MSAQTWWLDPDSNLLSAVDTGAEATTATGWTVAKVAPTVYALMATSVKRASTVFLATVVPDGTTDPATEPVTSYVFPLSVESGTYDTGTWTLTIKVIAVSSGGDSDGLIRAAIWKGPSGGAGPMTLLAGPTEGTTVTNLAVGVAQTSTVTFSGIAAKTLTNEELNVQIGWKITGAGGANTRDIVLRKGTGITLVTPNFTAAPATIIVNEKVALQSVKRAAFF